MTEKSLHVNPKKFGQPRPWEKECAPVTRQSRGEKETFAAELRHREAQSPSGGVVLGRGCCWAPMPETP